MPYRLNRKVIAISKVFQKGKIQLPKNIRTALAVKDGDNVVWYQNEEGNYLVDKA